MLLCSVALTGRYLWLDVLNICQFFVFVHLKRMKRTVVGLLLGFQRRRCVILYRLIFRLSNRVQYLDIAQTLVSFLSIVSFLGLEVDVDNIAHRVVHYIDVSTYRPRKWRLALLLGSFRLHYSLGLSLAIPDGCGGLA